MVTLYRDLLFGDHTAHLGLEFLLSDRCGRVSIIHVKYELGGISTVINGITDKVTPALGGHGPYSQASANTNVFVKEIGAFGIDRCSGVEVYVDLLIQFVVIEILSILQVFISKVEALGAEAHAHGYGKI